jgi:hypothetical protein
LGTPAAGDCAKRITGLEQYYASAARGTPDSAALFNPPLQDSPPALQAAADAAFRTLPVLNPATDGAQFNLRKKVLYEKIRSSETGRPVVQVKPAGGGVNCLGSGDLGGAKGLFCIIRSAVSRNWETAPKRKVFTGGPENVRMRRQGIPAYPVSRGSQNDGSNS